MNEEEYKEIIETLMELDFTDIEKNKVLVNVCFEEFRLIFEFFQNINEETPQQKINEEIETAYSIVNYIFPVYLIQLEQQEDYENATALHKIAVNIITTVEESVNPLTFDHKQSTNNAKKMILISTELTKKLLEKWND